MFISIRYLFFDQLAYPELALRTQKTHCAAARPSGFATGVLTVIALGAGVIGLGLCLATVKPAGQAADFKPSKFGWQECGATVLGFLVYFATM